MSQIEHNIWRFIDKTTILTRNSEIPVNMIHLSGVGLTLGRRRRRRASISQTPAQMSHVVWDRMATSCSKMPYPSPFKLADLRPFSIKSCVIDLSLKHRQWWRVPMSHIDLPHIIRSGRRPGAYLVYCTICLCPNLRKEGCRVWKTVNISEKQSLWTSQI